MVTKGYRTVFFNIVKGVVDSGILLTLLAVDWETAGFSAKSAVWIALVLSLTDKVMNLYLRSITTTPLGEKW